MQQGFSDSTQTIFGALQLILIKPPKVMVWSTYLNWNEVIVQ